MSDSVTRRVFFKQLAFASAGGALLTACSQPAAPAATAKSGEAAKAAEPAKPAAPAAAAKGSANIVVPSFPAQWADGLQAGVIPCYKGKTGGDAELALSGVTNDHVQKIMATRDKPALDVMLATDTEIFQILELGIADKLEPAKIPNLAGIQPFFKDPYEGYAFAFDGGGFGLTYNSDRIKNPPSTWLEFVERVTRGEFGRAVMYPHISNSNAQPINWLINRELGGSITDMSPFMKRMSEMKANVLKFYASSAEPSPAFTRGEIDMAIWTDGRTFFMQEQGASNIQYKVLGPGAPALSVGFMKVKNGSDHAWEYLNCCADPKNQNAWNKFFPGYYMSHKDIEYPPESKAKQDPSSLDGSFKNFIFPPWKELARAWPQWVEAWTREIGA